MGAGSSWARGRAVRIIDVLPSRHNARDPSPLVWPYALVDGIFNIIAFFRVTSHHWALLIEGAVGIIAGVLTFAWPAITTFALLYMIAFWAILTGIFEIIAGIRLRMTWLMVHNGLHGVLSTNRLFKYGCVPPCLGPYFTFRLTVWQATPPILHVICCNPAPIPEGTTAFT